MQEGCSGSRQPQHKQRAANFVLRYFRMQTQVALQQETVAQDAKNVGTQGDVSDHIQAGVSPA